MSDLDHRFPKISKVVFPDSDTLPLQLPNTDGMTFSSAGDVMCTDCGGRMEPISEGDYHHVEHHLPLNYPLGEFPAQWRCADCTVKVELDDPEWVQEQFQKFDKLESLVPDETPE